jgi:muramoyltetrapeptide carboxypeptidase
MTRKEMASSMSKEINLAVMALSGLAKRGDIEHGIGLLEEEFSSEEPGCRLRVVRDYLRDAPRGAQLPYLPASDEFQAKVFTEAMARDDIHYIWAARGGYGSSRWLHLVAWDELPRRGPLLIGFSDITFIHSALVNFLERPGLHAPMAITYGNTSRESRVLLIKAMASRVVPGLAGRAIVSGQAEGPLIGGNLSCLCHTIGTPWEPLWDGAILFLEDINEPAYRIDRMLTHLKDAGVLERISGLVLGRFAATPQKGNAGRTDVILPSPEEVIHDRLSGLSVPVVCSLPAGHGPGDNHPLYIGGRYRLSAPGPTAELIPLSSLG